MKLSIRLAHIIESAINNYLGLDPDTRSRLAELEGRIIALEFRGLDLTLLLCINAAGITLPGETERAADTVLSGTPLGMARLGLGSNTAGTLFSGDVEITGDVETGQAFKALLDDMDIDWEEHLSHLTGDVIAHQLGNAARTAAHWLRHTGTTLEQDLSEYLQEELRVLPTRIETENFFADVDSLGMDVERVAARIRRLQAKRGGT